MTLYYSIVYFIEDSVCVNDALTVEFRPRKDWSPSLPALRLFIIVCRQGIA